MIKVSIIVPVYNAEFYLRPCIDSILNQTYKNIEIILVDNGSTDSSRLICEEYSKKHDNIKFDFQEKKGPSATRNKGIDLATGEYIQFVDSDDYIEKDMTEKLVSSMAGKADLAICGFNTLTIGDKNTKLQKMIPQFSGVISIEEFNKKFGELFNANLINSPCNKLYNKNLIKKNRILFKEDVNIGEDLLFNLQYFKQCTNISLLNESLYNYLRINNITTLTSSYKEDFFINQKMLFESVREYLCENNTYDSNKDFIENRYTFSIIGCFENLFHKNSNLNYRLIKKEIIEIILDEDVINSIEYFLKGDAQRRLIGYCIKNKSANLIYLIFTLKKFIRNRLTPIFNLLKKINRKFMK